ncbi:MAG: UDP-N-acetylmuramate dehydrogenase [Sphingobacteriaceae bacterium]|jgi:UDP-N-acetylmuramate dehydrogenase|nr:UDP-N-acetylmuramate dehydrogenase [Sphingobacteriaceae bacterium]
MPQILENISLKKFNTFGVEASARWFVEIRDEEELAELFEDKRWKSENLLVIGGGSNMLLTKDFDGLVIRMCIRGISNEISGDDIYVTAGAGEVWNDFVNYCVNRGFAGVENLSLIPGSVGASPIQNIGAYGVELKDVFHSCRAFEIGSGQIRRFDNKDCKFGYRESVFKSELKGKYIITSVTFRLSASVQLNISYGAITQELQNRKIENPTIKDVSQVVSHIRVSKLPDPSTIGNAGSFFKNPVVSVDKFRQLQSSFPDIVHFSVDNGMEKIAAGWMIEKLGWKGKTIGHVGTWKNQALVLVNHGNATGTELYDLSSEIISDVKSNFDIELQREVNII